MKDKLNRPCVECPFLKTSQAGWLGSSTAQEFIEGVDHQEPMPCHMTVDYSNPDWPETLDDAAYCAGAAIYLNNTWSMPRDPEWGTVVRRLSDDRDNVFTWTDKFLAHHDNERNRQYVEASQRHGSGKRHAVSYDDSEEYERDREAGKAI